MYTRTIKTQDDVEEEIEKIKADITVKKGTSKTITPAKKNKPIPKPPIVKKGTSKTPTPAKNKNISPKKKIKDREFTFYLSTSLDRYEEPEDDITFVEQDDAFDIIQEFESNEFSIREIEMDRNGEIRIFVKDDEGLTDNEIKDEIEEYLEDKVVESDDRRLFFFSHN